MSVRPWHPLFLLAVTAMLAGCAGVPAGGGTQGATVDWFAWHARGPGGAPLAPRLVQTLQASGVPFDSAPKAFDLDGDGVDEIIAQGNDTNVYVFDSSTGKVLAKLPTPTPANWYVERVLNPVDAAVLAPGQPASIVVSTHAAYLAVWRLDPAASTGDRLSFTKTWERRLDDCHFDPSADAKPALADVDGDGTIEIAAQAEENGLYLFGADGKLRWKRCWAGGNANPQLDDLDGDGRKEAVFASDSGRVSVLDGRTGEPVWTYDAGQLLWPASISVAPAIAELDGTSPKEVLFTARHAGSRDPKDFPKYHMAVFAVHGAPGAEHGSELLWMRQPEWANPLSYTRLQVADVDGDGQADVFGMDWNTIGHKPGNWEPLNKTNLFRLDAAGNDVWVRNVTAWWSNKDLLLADGDGDGDLDVLANGAQLGVDGIYRIDARTGQDEGFLPAAGWKVLRGPQLLDLRHDGGRQVILPVATKEGPEKGAILVIDLGRVGAAA